MDPNTVTYSGDLIALELACTGGQVETAKLLIDSGADINHQDRNLRNTSLISATICGHEQCVQLLLSRGADVHRKDSSGYTALDRAKQLKNTKITSLLELAEGEAQIGHR